jgi:spore maturation protein CgeB
VKVALFYQSLLSDWNHGNAHFLRGVATELIARGHQVTVFEPADSWCYQSMVEEYGASVLDDFQRVYPGLKSERYETLDLDSTLAGVDLVIVHEWNSHDLVRRIGAHRAANSSYRLLFHDTHHRAVTATEEMRAYDLTHYDGVLAYGAVLREIYLREAWTKRAWTWHEAADVRVFQPAGGTPTRDLVWIGNWGDDERTAELHEFLIEPVKKLGLSAAVYGVRYPESGRAALEEAGIEYRGWLPNFRAPEVFAQFRVTVHVPRRPYVQQLPGIPTIRPFEALACGIPMVSAPWNDSEGLFTPGRDFLVAKDGNEMCAELKRVLEEPELARDLAQHGRETILRRHTCAHRVEELLRIYEELGTPENVGE